MREKHRTTGLLLSVALTFGLLSAGFVLAGHKPGHNPGGGGGDGGGKPLQPLKIFLLAGQSNMVGQGANADLETLAPVLQLPQADVQIFHNGAWKDLQPGLGKSVDHFGPELMFGRVIADVLPNDNIALIKFASGGTNLANDWDPFAPGFMWTGFVDAVNSALAAIDPTVYEPEIVGMAWMQGERDSKFEEMALAYEQNLTDFIGAVRTQFGVPNLPFVIGQIHSKNTGPYKLVIQEAQLNVSLAVPNTALVYTDDLSLWDDLLHYDSAGQLEFGARFATEMLTFSVDVDSISYATSGGKGGTKNLTVTVAIVDEMGPVSGASVSVTLIHESGDFWEITGTTANDGTVSFPLKNAPPGCYITTVTDVTAGILIWDGSTPPNGFCK